MRRIAKPTWVQDVIARRDGFVDEIEPHPPPHAPEVHDGCEVIDLDDETRNS